MLKSDRPRAIADQGPGLLSGSWMATQLGASNEPSDLVRVVDEIISTIQDLYVGQVPTTMQCSQIFCYRYPP